jgi:catechol 2,3-dioxygenase-like lactoylglutathione lyase family enzyme
MSRRLALVALLVRDYDEAIAWYTNVLGFRLVEDTDMGNGKRWVVVAPNTVGPGAANDDAATGEARSTALLLARAATPRQEDRIGDQAGGRIFLVLDTDDFRRDFERLTASGVRFVEAPRHESYGVVAVFEDLYGNRWDLVERAEASE